MKVGDQDNYSVSDRPTSTILNCFDSFKFIWVLQALGAKLLDHEGREIGSVVESWRTWITSISAAWTAKRYGKPVIAIGGCLSSDVGVVYDHGIDAVFSVLSQICTVDEALTNAAENVRSASRNIAAALKLARYIRT